MTGHVVGAGFSCKGWVESAPCSCAGQGRRVPAQRHEHRCLASDRPLGGGRPLGHQQSLGIGGASPRRQASVAVLTRLAVYAPPRRSWSGPARLASGARQRRRSERPRAARAASELRRSGAACQQRQIGAIVTAEPLQACAQQRSKRVRAGVRACAVECQVWLINSDRSRFGASGGGRASATPASRVARAGGAGMRSGMTSSMGFP